jgi:hypothetical protein
MCSMGCRGWARVDTRILTRCFPLRSGTGSWCRRRTSESFLCPLRERKSCHRRWPRLQTRPKREMLEVPKGMSACAAPEHQGVASWQGYWKILEGFSYRHHGEFSGKDVLGKSSEPRLETSSCPWLVVGTATAEVTARRTPSDK